MGIYQNERAEEANFHSIICMSLHHGMTSHCRVYSYVMVEFVLMHSLAGPLNFVAYCSECWRMEESDSKTNSGFIGQNLLNHQNVKINSRTRNLKLYKLSSVFVVFFPNQIGRQENALN
jgi:hypothetical protein